MARIRVTGYINTDDLEESEVDLDDDMGLSEEGYQNIVHGESGSPYKLLDLEDLEIEKE